MPRKLEDLTGKRFNKLVVIEYAGKVPVGKRCQPVSAWICRCDCGNVISVLNNNLKRGITNSCGCYHRQRAKESNLKDISGNTYGMLIAIEYVETRNKNAYWKCICSCGNTCIVAACALKSTQKSCGCRQGNFVHGEWSKGRANYAKFRRKDPLVRLKHNVSSSIRDALKSGKAGKKTFEQLPYTPKELQNHLESLFEPWMNWENYGGKSNDPQQTWHMDHIVPHCKFPYKSLNDPLFLECWDLQNLRPLEKRRNFAKGKKRQS